MSEENASLTDLTSADAGVQSEQALGETESQTKGDDPPSQIASTGLASAQAVLDADKKYENTVESVIQSASSVDESSMKPEKFVTIDGEDHESSGFWAKISKSFSGLSFGLKMGLLGGGALLIGAIVFGIILLCS